MKKTMVFENETAYDNWFDVNEEKEGGHDFIEEEIVEEVETEETTEEPEATNPETAEAETTTETEPETTTELELIPVPEESAVETAMKTEIAIDMLINGITKTSDIKECEKQESISDMKKTLNDKYGYKSPEPHFLPLNFSLYELIKKSDKLKVLD